MSLKASLFSGGKESLYAAMKLWPIDLFITFVYEFPRPSPHLVNLKQVMEVGGSIGIPVLVLKVDKGKEFEQEARLLRMIEVRELVAGDVYVEDHLNYLNRLTKEAGADLREPLWGMDTEELLRAEIRDGIVSMMIGGEEKIKGWIGRTIDKNSLEHFISNAKDIGIDPLGEKGEYHTIVLQSPLHRYRLRFDIDEIMDFKGYKIARLRSF